MPNDYEWDAHHPKPPGGCGWIILVDFLALWGLWELGAWLWPRVSSLFW